MSPQEKGYAEGLTMMDGAFPEMPRSILDEAQALITGPRLDDYGTQTLDRIADMWGTYLERVLDRRDVCMLMILLKVARDMHKPARDNSVDIAGYAGLCEPMQVFNTLCPHSKPSYPGAVLCVCPKCGGRYIP